MDALKKIIEDIRLANAERIGVIKQDPKSFVYLVYSAGCMHGVLQLAAEMKQVDLSQTLKEVLRELSKIAKDAFGEEIDFNKMAGQQNQQRRSKCQKLS